ncbi:MAG: hypothetical protein GC161_18210 [Planctomycetaceae bacterium]|nr:hypothetical protein [Planctomycetaceae bacterium]
MGHDDETDPVRFAELVRKGEELGAATRQSWSEDLLARIQEAQGYEFTHMVWNGTGWSTDVCAAQARLDGRRMTLAEAREWWSDLEHGWCDYAKRCRGTLDAFDAYCRCMVFPDSE